MAASRHPRQRTSTEMEEECVLEQWNVITKMARARRSKYDGRTQGAPNRELTMPPTSHRRHVFFSHSNCQFVNNRRVSQSFDSRPRPEPDPAQIPRRSNEHATLFPQHAQVHSTKPSMERPSSSEQTTKTDSYKGSNT